MCFFFSFEPSFRALFAMKVSLLAPLAFLASGAFALKREQSCEAQDLAIRSMFQNKLADVCVDMCKELGAYPEKCTCPNYSDTTDKTPNVITWDELLEYIGKVETFGHGKVQEWTKKYLAALQSHKRVKTSYATISVSQACLSQDLKH